MACRCPGPGTILSLGSSRPRCFVATCTFNRQMPCLCLWHWKPATWLWFDNLIPLLLSFWRTKSPHCLQMLLCPRSCLQSCDVYEMFIWLSQRKRAVAVCFMQESASKPSKWHSHVVMLTQVLANTLSGLLVGNNFLFVFQGFAISLEKWGSRCRSNELACTVTLHSSLK